MSQPRLALVLAICVSSTPVAAQPAAQPLAGPAPQAEASCCTIPAGTPVLLEVMEDVGSRRSRTGQMFGIRLAEPIMLDGRVAVPAGAMGVAEVVHAARAGTKPGELIVAARRLEVGPVTIPLHKTRFSRSGDERSTLIVAQNMAVLSTSGSNVELKSGSRLPAMVAAATIVAPAED